jgi:chemotaxis response regulator CheB
MHAGADLQISEFPIVGLGTSAGGTTALQGLFLAFPVRTNLDFVVIQHLLSS